jgi:hypothetical protein
MTNISELRFGLDTFGDMSNDLEGKPISAGQTIRNLIEQGKLADELGLSNFNVGEHHRDDFAISAPDTVLAGLATVRASPPSTRCRTDVPKSQPVEDPSSSLSRYSVSRCKTTKCFLKSDLNY